MSYWSDRFQSIYNKVKEKSRDVRVPTYNDFTVVNREIDNFHDDKLVADNLPNFISTCTTAISNVKYSEPFQSQSGSGIHISHSNYVDFKISKSNCCSTENTISNSQNVISKVPQVLQIENVNILNSHEIDSNLNQSANVPMSNLPSVIDIPISGTVSPTNTHSTFESTLPVLVSCRSSDVLSPNSPPFIPFKTSIYSGDANYSIVYTSQSTISHSTVSDHISNPSSLPLNGSICTLNPKYACVFCCNSTHNSHNCQKFNSSQEFWSVVLTEKRCRNCFRQYHQARSCYDQSFCKIRNCKRKDRHSPVLCRNYFRKFACLRNSQFARPSFSSTTHHSSNLENLNLNCYSQGTQTDLCLSDNLENLNLNCIDQGTQTDSSLLDYKSVQFPESSKEFVGVTSHINMNRVSDMLTSNAQQIVSNEGSELCVASGSNFDPVVSTLELSNLQNSQVYSKSLYDPDQISKDFYMNYMLQRKIQHLKNQLQMEK